MSSTATVVSPSNEIEVLCLSMLRRLHAYWRLRETPDSTDPLFCYWEDSLPFSARFLSDIMLGYLAIGLHDNDASATKKVHEIFSAIIKRQDPDGSFRWNLPDAYSPGVLGIRDQVDLGMVLDAMDLLVRLLVLSSSEMVQARELVRKAAFHLLDSEWPGYPGIIRKRYYEGKPQLPIDVLNAEAMAAKSLVIAATINNAPQHLSAASRFLKHLESRFGCHYEGWWPYSESLVDHRPVSPASHGRSIFFQSMMVVHLSDLATNPILDDYHSMVRSAAQTVAGLVTEDGQLKPDCESRHEFIGKPNVVVADCLLRLRDPETTARARARLEYLSSLVITDDGDVQDERGQPLTDMWRIWAFSDLARLLLRASLSH